LPEIEFDPLPQGAVRCGERLTLCASWSKSRKYKLPVEQAKGIGLRSRRLPPKGIRMSKARSDATGSEQRKAFCFSRDQRLVHQRSGEIL
jgi:hypothetical protein